MDSISSLTRRLYAFQKLVPHKLGKMLPNNGDRNLLSQEYYNARVRILSNQECDGAIFAQCENMANIASIYLLL